MECDEYGLATVIARKGQAASLARCVEASYGIALPQGPGRASAGDFAFLGIAPGAWFAIHQHGSNGFSHELRTKLADFASVSDQTDGQAVLHLSGERVLDALAKGVAVDLHPRTFRVGDVAVTAVAHIGVTLWRLKDNADGGPVFEVAINRSLARGFWHWLAASSAEFGLAIARSD